MQHGKANSGEDLPKIFAECPPTGPATVWKSFCCQIILINKSQVYLPDITTITPYAPTSVQNIKKHHGVHGQEALKELHAHLSLPVSTAAMELTSGTTGSMKFFPFMKLFMIIFDILVSI